MSKKPNPRKDALERAVAEHLTRNGSKNWQPLRDQFPDVSDSTFWRVVRSFRRDMGNLTPQAKQVLRKVQEVKDHLPIVVPPGTAVGDPERVRANLDYARQLEEAATAAKLLHEWSMKPDGTVRVPAFLRDAARLRLEIVRTAVDVYAFLADVRRVDAFVAAVIEEVGKESPDTQKAIVERLAELNRQWGMTPAAMV